MPAASAKPSPPSDRHRGVLAIVDQMIVSGTQFLLIAAMGRYAGAAALGQFMIGYSVVVIATTVLRSLLMTPYAVFTHGEPPAKRKQLRGCVILRLAMITMGIAGCTALAAMLIGLIEPRLSSATAIEAQSLWGPFLFAVALTIPFFSLRELARQMSFADMQFRRAILVDSAASASQIGIVAGLVLAGQFTAVSLMLVLALTTGVVGLAWLLASRRRFEIDRDSLPRDWIRIWRFGRWGAMSQSSHVVEGYALNWILAATGSLAAAGLYAAVSSVVRIASPFVQGAGNALTPLLAKRLHKEGIERLVDATNKFTRLSLVAAAVYFVIMCLAGPFLIRLIYGPQFGDTAQLVALLTGSVVISAIVLIATKSISVLNYPQINFVLNLASLVVTITLATALGYSFGINGAATGLLISTSLAAAAKWICFLRIVRRATNLGLVAQPTAGVQSASK